MSDFETDLKHLFLGEALDEMDNLGHLRTITKYIVDLHKKHAPSPAPVADRAERDVDAHFLRSMSASLSNEGKDFHAQRCREIADLLAPPRPDIADHGDAVSSHQREKP